MEAKEFLREWNRMCNFYDLCEMCPANKKCGDSGTDHDTDVETVDIVEKWSKENPIKTNADKFKEDFGIELKSSEERHGYLYLSSLDSVWGFNSKESLDKWLEAEYKEPEKKNTIDKR